MLGFLLGNLSLIQAVITVFGVSCSAYCLPQQFQSEAFRSFCPTQNGTLGLVSNSISDVILLSSCSLWPSESTAGGGSLKEI